MTEVRTTPATHGSPAVEDLADAWREIREGVRASVGELTFHLWLDPLDAVAVTGGTLVVRAADHLRTWVEARYLPLIGEVATRVLGTPTAVELVGASWRAPAPDRQSSDACPSDGELNPKYRFEQFVIAEGNHLAHAAALAVAEMPSQAYNPLFIHGPPGLGKTHLLHAIGHYVRAFGLGLSVRYATIEDFTGEFVAAMRGRGDLAAFKERFRSVDVLLIDDVQFLAERTRTKEEFFHTFNALFESGKQLVLTSDRAPAGMDDLEQRLIERFTSGLVADVQPPDLAARLAILRTRARVDELDDIGDDTLVAIARAAPGSVRALEGALIRVVAHASLRGTPPSPALAGELLEQVFDQSAAALTVEAVQAAVAEAFQVPCADLLAHDRRPPVARARQVAMFLARQLTSASLPEIGRAFGGRNHSTVLHAHRRVGAAVEQDAHLADRVRAIAAELSGKGTDRS